MGALLMPRLSQHPGWSSSVKDQAAFPEKKVQMLLYKVSWIPTKAWSLIQVGSVNSVPFLFAHTTTFLNFGQEWEVTYSLHCKVNSLHCWASLTEGCSASVGGVFQSASRLSETMAFPAGFGWGAVTSAYQVEGRRSSLPFARGWVTSGEFWRVWVRRQKEKRRKRKRLIFYDLFLRHKLMLAKAGDQSAAVILVSPSLPETSVYIGSVAFGINHWFLNTFVPTPLKIYIFFCWLEQYWVTKWASPLGMKTREGTLASFLLRGKVRRIGEGVAERAGELEGSEQNQDLEVA